MKAIAWFLAGFAAAVLAYLAAVWVSFRMLGNDDEPGGGWQS